MSRKSCGRKAMRKHRGYILKALAVIVTAVLLTVPVSAHGGRTDSQGGHNSPSGYHYHHGYPAHQHDGGHCPYKTSQSGASEKSGANDTIAAQENILNDEDSLRAEVLAYKKELAKQIKSSHSDQAQNGEKPPQCLYLQALRRFFLCAVFIRFCPFLCL